MITEQALGSWLTEQFDGTREERPFNFATLITDIEETQSPAEREQRAVAYAYDRARALCAEAIANSGLHESYLAEAEAQFATAGRATRSAWMSGGMAGWSYLSGWPRTGRRRSGRGRSMCTGRAWRWRRARPRRQTAA
jgi:hypothetical protein